MPNAQKFITFCSAVIVLGSVFPFKAAAQSATSGETRLAMDDMGSMSQPSMSPGMKMENLVPMQGMQQKPLAAEPPTDPAHAAHVAAASQAGGQTVDAKLAEMLARIQRLEATVQQQQSGSTSGAGPMSGMTGMGSGTKPMQEQMAGKSAMGAVATPSGGAPGAAKPAGGMGGAGSTPGGMMSMMDKMMGMMDKMMSMGDGTMPAGTLVAGMSGGGRMGMEKTEMVGKTGAVGSKSATMPSDLPGFPGASQIYHIGATGFFADSAAIKLTADQQAAINGIKETSIANLGAAQCGIDQAEHDLWTVTGSDRPDTMTLETKVRDIERLKGDQRIAFIRSVGEAARVLTDDQRVALRGTGAPQTMQTPARQGSAGSDNPQGGMGPADPKAEVAGMGDDSMGNMDGRKTTNTKTTCALK